MKRFISYISAITLGTAGCASNQGAPEKTVDHVDLQRFMGNWYVIANIPTYFETEANNAIETYRWNEPKQRIDVDYKHHEKTPDGPLKSYPQKAFVYNETTNAEWRVQPLWPFKFAYLIVDLAPDYAWTVIGVPSRSHVWIMARKPKLDDSILNSLKTKLAARGYDMGKLRIVPQVW